MATGNNSYVYFVTVLPSTTNGVISQDVTWNNNSVKSRIAGFGSVTFGFVGDVSKAVSIAADRVVANASNTLIASQAEADAKLFGKIAKFAGPLGGTLGIVQVGFNAADKDFNINDMSVGELLNLTAAVSAVIPGIGAPIALASGGLSALYAIYENKYGEITIGDVGEAWDSTVFAKLDGRDPSLGKAVLEKLLPITNKLNKIVNEIENNISEFVGDIKESAQELMKGIDDLSAKIDGRDPSLGKSILEKLLPIVKELNKITNDIENNIAEFADDIKKSAQELMKDIDDFFEKIDGRDPSWGKLILDKVLKLTDYLNNDLNNWFEEQFDWLPDDFKEWLELNRSGKFHIYDPLVLDLDGDGIELLKANGWNGVQFDYNGDGIKSSTGWVKSDDGLLVWDRNG
ncbi:MAG: hypothetical protein IK065_03620, partial [Neisseriaceae bacterium]|nr:hypothetical protein [Neisseriaceae bacterium]